MAEKTDGATRQYISEHIKELIQLLTDARDSVTEAEQIVAQLQSQLDMCQATRKELEKFYNDAGEACLDVQASMVHTDHQVELANRKLRSAQSHLEKERINLLDVVGYVDLEIANLKEILDFQ